VHIDATSELPNMQASLLTMAVPVVEALEFASVCHARLHNRHRKACQVGRGQWVEEVRVLAWAAGGGRSRRQVPAKGEPRASPFAGTAVP
jgi:hypothetical protein